ncbi:hypothetical protein SAMN04487911_10589 [Arenibacter nanhaiticus]|uniref:Uncharacterized protein n=1 Tax=Arenibacter nanhaiticus TaxID=558155 RepID=A0A1M6DPM9_9FLAO|nr:hypothetical protein [Arenibacter nanhaiticus]SHI75123.1 hypothetical protein SAMN04487911_10589 [Arenibacter nanhaiticus]
MKKPSKIYRITAGSLLLFILALGLLFGFYNEELPKGEQGPKADALAKKMLTAIQEDNYKNTSILEWSFARGKHQYVWNKEENTVRVLWDEYRVHLNLKHQGKSRAYKNNRLLKTEKQQKIIQKATDYFNNDSFWLVAPFKVFDPGTERRLVTLKDGSQGLLVTYTQGGTTPGDSYLWLLGPDAVPKSFKMWVEIIPLGGLEASWEGWQKTAAGVLLPSSHQIGPITIGMGAVKAY